MMADSERCVCVCVYLSVVNDVEDGRGDYAADGVGQHKDHHILPSPQRDLNITVQHTHKTHMVFKLAI